MVLTSLVAPPSRRLSWGVLAPTGEGETPSRQPARCRRYLLPEPDAPDLSRELKASLSLSSPFPADPIVPQTESLEHLVAVSFVDGLVDLVTGQARADFL